MDVAATIDVRADGPKPLHQPGSIDQRLVRIFALEPRRDSDGIMTGDHESGDRSGVGENLARANELGVDVIVTDHHLPETELPPALAVINPSRVDCDYPNPNLCGAGVAFKLAHAILAGAGWPEAKLYRVVESFLKLVAIATVADIVPLTPVPESRHHAVERFKLN